MYYSSSHPAGTKWDLLLIHAQASVELFEGMIVSEGKRLQAEGKDGLIILPGVQDLLSSVRCLLLSPRSYV
jgi:hypothetical protein